MQINFSGQGAFAGNLHNKVGVKWLLAKLIY